MYFYWLLIKVNEQRDKEILWLLINTDEIMKYMTVNISFLYLDLHIVFIAVLRRETVSVTMIDYYNFKWLWDYCYHLSYREKVSVFAHFPRETKQLNWHTYHMNNTFWNTVF